MTHQENVAAYLDEMKTMHGHDMQKFHAEWHLANPWPQPPASPDKSWAIDNPFGTNFLQMHHEMVKAADDEPKFHMHHHPSIVSWYASKSLSLPALWDPGTPIPGELSYNPVPDSFELPNGTQIPLKRLTEDPQVKLPNYYTVAGIGPDESPEPITGARKLADFASVNQLGCCIVFPHNLWHRTIGGAMAKTITAILDPIFYFGVHWHIDKVFDDYKALPAPAPDIVVAHTEGISARAPRRYSRKDLRFLKEAQEAGKELIKGLDSFLNKYPSPAHSHHH